MAADTAAEELPQPIDPRLFSEARRKAARFWLPRIAAVLLSVVVVIVVGSLRMGLSRGSAVAMFGLGLDISGVWILAHAALLKPEEMARLGTWGSSSFL